jgi:hypothetical protein
MKKTTLGLSVVAVLAAAAVAMAAPGAAVGSGLVSAGETVHAVASRSEVGALPLSRCTVIDVTAGTTHEADRNPAKQMLPTWCP